MLGFELDFGLWIRVRISSWIFELGFRVTIRVRTRVAFSIGFDLET